MVLDDSEESIDGNFTTESRPEPSIPLSKSALEYMLGGGALLGFIKKSLEGYAWDEEKKSFVPFNPPFNEIELSNGKTVVVPTPFISQKGISIVLRALIPYSHPHAKLTIITDEDAREIAAAVHESLTDALYLHYDEINITPDDIAFLPMMIGTNVLFFLKSSVGGKTLERLTQFYQVSEVVQRKKERGE